MGRTAHKPLIHVNREESIGKPNMKKANIRMYRSKETLQQPPIILGIFSKGLLGLTESIESHRPKSKTCHKE